MSEKKVTPQSPKAEQPAAEAKPEKKKISLLRRLKRVQGYNHNESVL